MTTIKSYTDLEQSRKLAGILPLESADMWYSYYGNSKYNPTIAYKGQQWFLCQIRNSLHDDIPCWSLSALLEQLPYDVVDDDGNSVYLQMNKEDDVYQLVYTDPHGDFESIETDRYERFVDACYELILKLNELNLL